MSLELESVEVIESELAKHGVFASNTSGVSMQPLFKTHRDMVIIKKPDGELRKYDVALYRDSRSRYVLHRVIGVRDDEYIIRGDNTFVKEHVPKNAVIGVLIAFNRNGKRHSTDELLYKLYSRFWHFIYPLRHAKMATRRALARLYRKIFKKQK